MRKLLIGLTIGFFLGVTPVLFGVAQVFSDVPLQSWYSGAVTNLAEKDVIEGYSDGTFRPSDKVTRAEVAVMLDRLRKHIENKDYPVASQLLKIVQRIPTENDAFSFGGEDPDKAVLALEGDILRINAGYTGGCVDHEYTLMWEGMFLESNPVQANVHLIHDDNGDMCEAEISQELSFDLAPLRESYKSGYESGGDDVPSSGSQVILHVHGSQGAAQSIIYTF